MEEEEQEEINSSWQYILDQSNSHRLLYNLQILKELLECDLVEDP